jgi:hypothetical protein
VVSILRFCWAFSLNHTSLWGDSRLIPLKKYEAHETVETEMKSAMPGTYRLYWKVDGNGGLLGWATGGSQVLTELEYNVELVDIEEEVTGSMVTIHEGDNGAL